MQERRRRRAPIDRIDVDRIVNSTRTREDLLTFGNPSENLQKLEIPIDRTKERIDGENTICRISSCFHNTGVNHGEGKRRRDKRCSERRNQQLSNRKTLSGGFSKENSHPKSDRINGERPNPVATVAIATSRQNQRNRLYDID